MGKTPIQRLYSAVWSGDVELVKTILSQYPELKIEDGSDDTWLDEAARAGQIKVAKALLDLGFNVNSCRMPEEGTPLNHAIHGKHLDMAQFLLSRGADPKIGRTLIAAINIESEELGLEFVKVLVEHGAEVNRVFPWFGDDKVTFTPYTWALQNEKKEIADYLRFKGAVAPGENPRKTAPRNLSEEIVAYFEEQFGPVQAQALIEIVPTEPPIAVHVIRPGKGRNHVTLFTTGMSERAMRVPKGSEDYRFAELFIQLPAKWPLTREALADPNYGWPIHWLRSSAKYPHENKTWLGGPVTIIANGDPPERLAPKIKFTCMLLLAEKDFVSRAGRTIQFYRMMPLYTEERDLELSSGSAALMQAFDRCNVPFVVDLKRRNIAKP
jgi:hypothetical protein